MRVCAHVPKCMSERILNSRSNVVEHVSMHDFMCLYIDGCLDKWKSRYFDR